MSILDLPEDILSLVFVLLEPKDFLAFCRSSKALYTNYQKDSLFWRTQTSTTFRTPISPLLKTDGARWYSLYRRLKTQTRLYTWGQGLKGNLGHGVAINRGPVNRGPVNRGRIAGRMIPIAPRLRFQRTTSNWPTEAHVPDDVGVIADLQCGGWSTVILSSAGKLYAIGSINSANFVNVGSQTEHFERLEYLTQSTSALSQFSAGRSHILALTDDNEILSWDRINAKGLKVLSRNGSKFSGRPTAVVAGWGDSSAYVPELGIVYWSPLKNDQGDDMLDAREVKEKIIPKTARTFTTTGDVVQVTAHILLEGFIVWITSSSEIWACDISHQNQEDTEPTSPAVRLPGYTDGADHLSDIKGSFRNFVVLTSSGRVLAGSTDYVKKCFAEARDQMAKHPGEDIDSSDPTMWENLRDIISSRPRDLPALQHTGVISVQFGDWHYQALHSNGTITSHGHEIESCGALGLGDAFQGAKLRALYSTGPQGLRLDSKLRPVADLKGRQVWFEPEKLDWLKHLQAAAEKNLTEHPDEPYWNDILNDPAKQAMFSEWIEQEGRHWEDGPLTFNASLDQSIKKMELDSSEDSHVGAYFALAIGAAGWHTGALVLVDEEKADRTHQKWWGEANPIWVSEGFPRVRLPDGTEPPQPEGLTQGEHTLASASRPWRDGMPTVEELGLVQR
ncbi:hypothetical protein H2198_003679 [Neophaeococcomyces mojaviensis]|uniref:Uncharacterized protein n=1 Tax=Neophaeococcomyces mojaviensis TaxID=3383035 RepID=A0ACC3AAN1_9EURO|nr:hypothetical protein H2198_003679 [Knufia sp. JES_112]